MMPITIRNFTYQDMSKIITLLNKDREGSYEFRPLTIDSFRPWLQEGRLRILVAEKDENIVGSAGYNDGYWGEEVSWLITTENKEEKRTEVELLEQVEKYVRKGMLFAALDEGSPRIEELKERGYNVEGGMFHMVAKLGCQKGFPDVPKGILIRSLGRDEERAFVEAVNLGFQTERVKIGDIGKWKKESPPFDEEWISIAEVDRKIVSVVVAKPDIWFNKEFDKKRGYLGPATTLPEFRAKNLASALTVRAMNFLLAKGMDSVALYTSELNAPSVSLLKKIGFEVSHHWIFVRKHFDKLSSNQHSRIIC